MSEPSRRIRWFDPVVGGVVAEGLTIASIVLVARLSGHGAPGPDGRPDAVALRIGAVVAPIVGSLLCYVMGWWAARRVGERFELHGGLVGAVAAVLTGLAMIAGPLGNTAAYVIALPLKLFAARAGGRMAANMAANDPPAS